MQLFEVAGEKGKHKVQKLDFTVKQFLFIISITFHKFERRTQKAQLSEKILYNKSPCLSICIFDISC